MNIYFSGSIYGGRQKLDAYKELIGALQNYGTVLNPEVADSEVIEKENGVLDEDIFNSLKDRLDTANVVFAELTVPSLGVGYELGYADSHDIRIVGIYDKNVIPKVSTMIRGNKNIEIIPYNDLRDIINNLKDILSCK